LEHFSASGRLHSLEEAMRPRSFFLFWLISLGHALILAQKKKLSTAIPQLAEDGPLTLPLQSIE